MNKDKILRKIGKLLSLYGVDETEKQNFLLDLQDAKYDDEEDEETVEVETETETEAETETETETPVEEESLETETETELPVDEPIVEEEEKEVEADHTVDWEGQYNELKETCDSLSARLETLEGIVSKLGVEKEETTQFGVEPQSEGSKDEAADYFEYLNKKRVIG